MMRFIRISGSIGLKGIWREPVVIVTGGKESAEKYTGGVIVPFPRVIDPRVISGSSPLVTFCMVIG